MLNASLYYNTDGGSDTFRFAAPFLQSKQSQQTRFLFGGWHSVTSRSACPSGGVWASA